MLERLIFLVFILILMVTPTSSQEIIYANQIADKQLDQAVVILPGFGDSKRRRKAQLAFFKTTGYDVYIPNFSDRKSFDKCVSNLSDFVEKHEINKYQGVHYFCYILGTWVFNQYMLEETPTNVKTILYDRSPLQERAPKVAFEAIPLITKIIEGRVVGQLADIPYQPIPKNDIKIGIIIESKATTLIKIFKKQTLNMGPVEWHPDSLNQQYDDFFYVPLDHYQMYKRFDMIGSEIRAFQKEQKFSDEARREPFKWDPFKGK